MEQLKNEKEKVFGRKRHLDYIPVYISLFRYIKW